MDISLNNDLSKGAAIQANEIATQKKTVEKQTVDTTNTEASNLSVYADTIAGMVEQIVSRIVSGASAEPAADAANKETAPAQNTSDQKTADVEEIQTALSDVITKLTADPVLADSGVKLIGEHPLFPFDKSFLDTYFDTLKQMVKSGADVIDDFAGQIKTRLEQVMPTIDKTI